jgi:hypothetical protein
MTTLQSKVTIQAPTTNNDGSPITLPLTYTVFIDTVNPPVKSYPVPAAEITTGAFVVTFAQLGFTPVPGTDYNATVDCSDTNGTSLMSADVSFAYGVVPNAPTFTIS